MMLSKPGTSCATRSSLNHALIPAGTQSVTEGNGAVARDGQLPVWHGANVRGVTGVEEKNKRKGVRGCEEFKGVEVRVHVLASVAESRV